MSSVRSCLASSGCGLSASQNGAAGATPYFRGLGRSPGLRARRWRTPAVSQSNALTFVGLDVHRDTIAIAVLRPAEQLPLEQTIASTEETTKTD